MPRFNQKRWRPVYDTSPGYRTVDPHRVVLAIANNGDRLGCPCGCGEFPDGPKAVFRMGHDARLRGKLIRAHLSGVQVIEIIGDVPQAPEEAVLLARRHEVKGKGFTWEHYLDEAVERREGRNREVLARAVGHKKLIQVGRWEYTGQVAAVYRVDGEDYYEMEYVTKAGDIKRARVPAESTMPDR